MDYNRELHLAAVLHSALTILSVLRHSTIKTQTLVASSLLLCHKTKKSAISWVFFLFPMLGLYKRNKPAAQIIYVAV